MASPAYNSAYAAITRGDEPALDKLLRQHPGLERERGERIEWPNATLLEHAVWFHRDTMVTRLVAAGAPLTEPGGQPPMTPLRRALEMGADAIARGLGDPADRAEAAALNQLDLNQLEEPAAADDDERCRFQNVTSLLKTAIRSLSASPRSSSSRRRDTRKAC